jgi:hypothetical protein
VAHDQRSDDGFLIKDIAAKPVKQKWSDPPGIIAGNNRNIYLWPPNGMSYSDRILYRQFVKATIR